MDEQTFTFDDTDALLASLSGSATPYNSSELSQGTSPYDNNNNNNNNEEEGLFDFDNNELFDFGTQAKQEEMAGIYISPVSEANLQDDHYDAEKSESMKRPASSSTPTTANDKNKITKPKKDRSSHTVIEKKYRTNINAKIAALRDAVPALRIATGQNNMTLDDLDGLTPASKINKASVLTKAIEYIKHLERKNSILVNENNQLKQMMGHSNPTNNISPSVHQQVSPLQNQPIPQQVPHMPIAPQPHPQQQGQMHHSFMPQFQPALDMNGQPINMTQQQPAPQYAMGLPGKVLMGGLVTMAGQNMFSGNENFDFRGMNAFPILSSPQFAIAFNALKWALFGSSLLYLIVSIFFSSDNNKQNDDKKKQKNKVTLIQWYELIKQLVFIKVGLIQMKKSEQFEINQLINLSLFNGNCSIGALVYLLGQLNLYEANSELLMGKLIISKMMMTYSDLFQYLFKLHSVIDDSLKGIGKSKVNNINLRYFVKDFKLNQSGNKHVDSSEVFKRLINLTLGFNLNTNCATGINDKGYELILKDRQVTNDYKSLIISLRCNEIFREVLLEYIDLTFKKEFLENMDNDQLKEFKKEIWNKLSLCEFLAPKTSIIDIRIKLFKSILNERYLDEVISIISEESKALDVTDELNGNIMVEKKNDDKEVVEGKGDEEIKTLNELESDDEDELLGYDLEEDEEEGEEEDEEDEDEDDTSTVIMTFNNNLNPHFTNLLSQDLFNALTCSSILRYIKNGQELESKSLLKYLRIHKDEITLLSFLSLYKLVEKYPKNWQGCDKIEEIVGYLRLWIGDSKDLRFKDLDDGLELNLDISDKLVDIGRSFSEID